MAVAEKGLVMKLIHPEYNLFAERKLLDEGFQWCDQLLSDHSNTKTYNQCQRWKLKIWGAKQNGEREKSERHNMFFIWLQSFQLTEVGRNVGPPLIV